MAVTSSFDSAPLKPGETPCSHCGERPALDTLTIQPELHGWCWTCAHQRFTDLTADFPGNHVLALPVGDHVVRRVSQAAMRRNESEARRWLKHRSSSLGWRVFAGQQWGEHLADTRVLALIAFISDGIPASLIRCPWLYQQSPACEQPHAILCWLIWRPGKPGCLEGTWSPDEDGDWVARRLQPDAVLHRDEVLKLVIPDKGDPRVRDELVKAVTEFQAANNGADPGRNDLAKIFFVSIWTVDKRCQAAGIENLGGLLRFVRSLQAVQTRSRH